MANADKTKNIYGNSRHSSPIEMTSLLTTNGLAGSNQHSNPRGSSILKITQYKLQDVRFVEELGKNLNNSYWNDVDDLLNFKAKEHSVKSIKEN